VARHSQAFSGDIRDGSCPQALGGLLHGRGIMYSFRKGWRSGSSGKSLPSKREALSLIPSTPKTKTKTDSFRLQGTGKELVVK
jgi:hypothetical protein